MKSVLIETFSCLAKLSRTKLRVATHFPCFCQHAGTGSHSLKIQAFTKVYDQTQNDCNFTSLHQMLFSLYQNLAFLVTFVWNVDCTSPHFCYFIHPPEIVTFSHETGMEFSLYQMKHIPKGLSVLDWSVRKMKFILRYGSTRVTELHGP